MTTFTDPEILSDVDVRRLFLESKGGKEILGKKNEAYFSRRKKLAAELEPGARNCVS